MLRTVLLVSRWIAAAHDRWRAEVARRRPLSAELDLLHEKLERLRTENDLLRARLRRLPHRHRPRYRAWERLRILWHASRHGFSVRATARAFVVSAQTVINWRRDLDDGADRLVKPKSPINKLPDLIAYLVHRLKREWPRWGTRRIAGILARLGIRASRTSVQRILRRPQRRRGAVLPGRARRGPLLAKFPNHVWIIDFTKLGGIFRSVWVGAVIDAFSRKVVAIGVAPRGPSALSAVRLLRLAIRDVGVPRWLISDHGPEFTSLVVGRFLVRRGIRRRFGAIHKPASLSLLERFWGSLKREYARGLLLYRPHATIERQIRAYMRWANSERPHQGLGQRTPDDVFYGRAMREPRRIESGKLSVRFIDGDHRLPVLRFRAAA